MRKKAYTYIHKIQTYQEYMLTVTYIVHKDTSLEYVDLHTHYPLLIFKIDIFNIKLSVPCISVLCRISGDFERPIEGKRFL